MRGFEQAGLNIDIASDWSNGQVNNNYTDPVKVINKKKMFRMTVLSWLQLPNCGLITS